MKRFFCLLILFFLLILNCNYSVSQYGGSGTETVNAFVFLPDGSPARGANVELIDNKGWIDSIAVGSSPVINKCSTDKKGFFSLEIPTDNSSYNLQIDHQGGGIFIPLPVANKEPLKIQLKPYNSLKGSFTNDSTPIELFLSGTSYSTKTTESFYFYFPAVASGSYALICKNRNNNLWIANMFSFENGEKEYYFDKLSAKIDRLLIDNFDAGVGPTSIGKIFSTALGWYVLSDSLYFYWDNGEKEWTQGKSSIIGRSPIWFDSITYESNNKAFTFSTILDTSSPYANALIGINTKQLTGKGIDLSTLKNFSLRAWGKGNIRVRFESKGLEDYGYVLSFYTYIIKLQKNPTNYLIPVDSLKIIEKGPNPLSFPWEREAKNILRIEFEFSPSDNSKGDTLTLYLDDFYLEGITLSKLLSDVKNMALTKGKNNGR
ncbi:MAG: hypothetical protein N2053_01495 [Chitinispirillaceae bacterium]|nr:hypothetical protein [Chitinispirillaceae bacterium]